MHNMILEKNNEYQGLIFLDGYQTFIKGERWPGDYEGEELGERFRRYFNKNFSKKSIPVELSKGIKVIKVNCSIDLFDDHFAEVWDNKMGKLMTEKEFISMCTPTFTLGKDISIEDFLKGKFK